MVGLMGAGKTTVGRLLAKRSNKDFVDLDHEIEASTGVRIPMIFEIEGEVGFRDRETHLLVDLSSRKNMVLATGGGVILRPENRIALKQMGTVIYLNATPKVLFDRTRRDRNRPLLQVADPLKKLEELYAQRDPLYREVADIIIDTRPGAVAQIVAQVEKELARCES
jgi:shikimate kinase